MILMADTNGYTQYYRYFFWYKGSDERLCVVTSNWIFKEDLSKLIDKQNIEKNGVKFIVNDKFKQDYIKILKSTNVRQGSNKSIIFVAIILIFITICSIFSCILFNRCKT